MIERYVELAAAGTFIVEASGRQIEIEQMLITSDTEGSSLTLAESGGVSRKLFLRQGINTLLKFALVYTPTKNVTLTATGGNVTILFRYNLK